MEPLVRYECSEDVSTITLDDGKANVMSVAMLQQLNAALDRAQADNTVVLLVGRTGMFSGGFDLAVFRRSREEQLEMLTAGALTAERLLSFPAPVIAACTGHAIAMGAFLLLACDARVGIAGGSFKICVNEVQIGLTVPRFAIELCRQRLTPASFNRAVITAQPHDPDQAVTAGFLDDTVPAMELMSAARGTALAAVKLVRESYVATKRRARENTVGAMRAAVAADLEEWGKRRHDRLDSEVS